jgi:hypothetical protein
MMVMMACSSDRSIHPVDAHSSGADSGNGGTDGHHSGPAVDAQMFPAVCQALPLLCPDAASLASCEAQSGSGWAACSYIPITVGCTPNSHSCPSAAQVCRTVENPLGYCTHACVQSDDCPIAGGGMGTCTQIDPGLSICIVHG